MASGTFRTNTGTKLNLRVDWESTLSDQYNASTVGVYVYLEYTSINVGARDNGYIECNGERKTFHTDAIYTTDTSTLHSQYFYTGWFKVDHNIDGSKDIRIDVGWNFNGVYSGISIPWVECGNNVTLDVKPRVSDIYSIDDTTIGNVCNVTWTPLSSSFYYKLMFSIGTSKSTTGVIHPGSTSQYTYTGYTFPLVLCNQITNSASGSATATLYTYSNSNCSTLIGSTSKTFYLHVPSNIIPEITDCSFEPVNSNSIIDGWGVYVKGYSKAKLICTATPGEYGATISSYIFSSGVYTETQTSSTWTSDTIKNGGTIYYSLYAKDSRGRTSEKFQKSITVYDYYEPSITNFTVSRNSSDSSKMTVNLSYGFADVNGNNSVTAILYYKQKGLSSWSEYGSISSGSGTTVTIDGGFDETKTYDFKVVVTDLLLNKSQDTAIVSTIKVLVDFRAGGKGLGIGKVCESDALEIALPTKFSNNIYVNDIPIINYINSTVNMIGTCSTASGNSTKIVVCEKFILIEGVRIRVRFTNTNTNTSPSLNVNSTGAKPIRTGSMLENVKAYTWPSGAVVDFYYDGANWVICSPISGTWTPTVKFGSTSATTYSFQNGSFYKVGNIVTLTFSIRVTAPISGNISIGGFNSVCGNATSYYSGGGIFLPVYPYGENYSGFIGYQTNGSDSIIPIVLSNTADTYGVYSVEGQGVEGSNCYLYGTITYLCA